MDHFFCLIFALVLLQSTFFFREAEVSVSVSEGQDCVLPCSGHKEVRVSVLQWIQSDSNKLLLVFRAGQVLDAYEHSDFTNRVQLLEPKLDRGNLSVVLKNVTFKDSGDYKCLALYENGPEIPQVIRLNVTEREPDTTIPTKEANLTMDLVTALLIVMLVLIVLFLLIGMIWYRRRHKRLQFCSCESDLENSIPLKTSSSLSKGPCMKPLVKDGPSPHDWETPYPLRAPTP